MAKKRRMPDVVKKAAMDVACPHCDAAPGDDCRTKKRDGTLAVRDEPHTRRVVRAFEEGALTIREKRS